MESWSRNSLYLQHKHGPLGTSPRVYLAAKVLGSPTRITTDGPGAQGLVRQALGMCRPSSRRVRGAAGEESPSRSLWLPATGVTPRHPSGAGRGAARTWPHLDWKEGRGSGEMHRAARSPGGGLPGQGGLSSARASPSHPHARMGSSQGRPCPRRSWEVTAGCSSPHGTSQSRGALCTVPTLLRPHLRKRGIQRD